MFITFGSLFSQVNKGDSHFYEVFRELPFEQREDLIVKEILSGNIPEYMKGFIAIRSVQRDSGGEKHRVIIFVKSDYLTVGSGKSSFIVPMSPKTAQRIADSLYCSLPTPKIVDLIYKHARLKLEPFNYIPRGHRNETPDIFYDHSRVIFAQIQAAGKTPGILIAGTKKDVVISSLLSDPARTKHVTIYGWHRLDGTPIQPLYNGHIESYVDYSHGVRLIWNKVLVDGKEYDLRDILKDKRLYAILSGEAGPLKRISYLD
jgi:hypothetical protein